MVDVENTENLIICASGPEGKGYRLHLLLEHDYKLPEYEVPENDHISVRDCLAAGSLMLVMPMDMSYKAGNIFYVANAYMINLGRALEPSKTGPTEPATGQGGAAAVTKSMQEDSASSEVQPRDLFIFTPGKHLYKLPEKMYTSFLPPPDNTPSQISIRDLLVHGTVFGAMPPTAGTLCYLISLTSLKEDNPAFSSL